MKFKPGDECVFINSRIKCIILEPPAAEPLRPGQVYIHNLFFRSKISHGYMVFRSYREKYF